MKKNRKGFTLVELLGVLVILALLILLISRPIINMMNKTKTEISSTQEKSILNAAEKWSVDNSDKFDDIEGTVSQIGLDVVFILDVTGSMTSNITGASTPRYRALVDAVNSAMDIMQSDLNKMAIYTYSTTGSQFLGLASYTSSDGKFLQAGSSSITTSSTIRRNGAPLPTPIPSVAISGNTNIQYGLVNGGKLLATVPHSETVNRIPVVVFLTDGEANQSTAALCTLSGTVCGTTTTNMSNTTGFGSAHFHLALLAGYEYRQKIASNYSDSSEVFFYTIGLGVSAADSKKLLDPTTNTKTNNYNYVTKAFIDGNMTAEDLKDIFSGIATEVVEATKVTQVCVTVEELYNGGYLEKKDISLASGEAASTYVLMSYNETINQYGFALAKTTAQIDACKALLEPTP